jgi:hypothetical protein
VLRDGLEPPSPDYKTGILAFVLTEHKMVPPTRIELVMTGYQPIVIPFNYRGIKLGDPYRIRTGVLRRDRAAQ